MSRHSPPTINLAWQPIFSGAPFQKLRLSGAIMMGCAAGFSEAGEPVRFDSSFMQPFNGTSAGPNLDLDAIANGVNVGPGTYLMLLRLNQSFYDRRELTVEIDDNSEARPCLSPTLLKEMGVKLQIYETPDQPLPECVDLQALIDGASVSLDGNLMVVDISIPQIALRRDAAGYVNPAEWDRGINAALLNYQFSAAQSHNNSRGTSEQYNLYTTAGINLGDWRFRSNASLSHSTYGRRKWQRSNTYAQRDLTDLKSTLTLGETFTPGDVFNSMQFRGAQIASDIGMLPNSMQGFAPVIRGMAETQAKVEVKQNGYSLYTTYVAPGAFEIDDLSAASGSGELEVIITEADGRERRFTQPYATLGNMLREKNWRYSLTLGEYTSAYGDLRPHFAQASLAYGLPYDLTLYGGLQGSEFYRAGALGVSKSLGNIGAVSLDVTQSQTDTPRNDNGPATQQTGQSYSLRYGKAFQTGTSVRFAGYRYSTEDYRDFSEAVAMQRANASYSPVSRRRRLEASVNQSLQGFGSMYLNYSHQNYWGSSHVDKQVQLGVSTQYKGVSYSLYASKSLSDNYDQGAQIGLSLSMPFGGGGRSSSSANFTMTRNSDGSLDQRAGLSGRKEAVTYNVDASHAQHGGNAGSARLGYQAQAAQLSAGVSAGKDYRQVSVGASGSMLAHAGGLEFGQSLGETVALIEVKGTPGVGVNNAPGIRTNDRGYALVPYVQPYRKNRITLDTSDLDPTIDIHEGVMHVVPRRGAVVKAVFKASRSEKVILNLRLANGSVPPFGTSVLDEAGVSAGVVGPGGQVLLSGVDGTVYHLKWGEKNEQQCEVRLNVGGVPITDGYRVVGVTCEKRSKQT
ncbi:fimbrial biogenesis outer membrane usher protein [Pseudomonas alkylphenolica]|nr:fimbrial biogenesis outer membrane usher protein [Pseudomonas alkylphenolica]